MSRTVRDAMKRKVAQAVVNINLAASYLSELETEFRPVHPELADGLKVALELAANELLVIDAFALAAWDMESPDWTSWT